MITTAVRLAPRSLSHRPWASAEGGVSSLRAAGAPRAQGEDLAIQFTPVGTRCKYSMARGRSANRCRTQSPPPSGLLRAHCLIGRGRAPKGGSLRSEQRERHGRKGRILQSNSLRSGRAVNIRWRGAGRPTVAGHNHHRRPACSALTVSSAVGERRKRGSLRSEQRERHGRKGRILQSNSLRSGRAVNIRWRGAGRPTVAGHNHHRRPACPAPTSYARRWKRWSHAIAEVGTAVRSASTGDRDRCRGKKAKRDICEAIADRKIRFRLYFTWRPTSETFLIRRGQPTSKVHCNK